MRVGHPNGINCLEMIGGTFVQKIYFRTDNYGENSRLNTPKGGPLHRGLVHSVVWVQVGDKRYLARYHLLIYVGCHKPLLCPITLAQTGFNTTTKIPEMQHIDLPLRCVIFFIIWVFRDKEDQLMID